MYPKIRQDKRYPKSEKTESATTAVQNLASLREVRSSAAMTYAIFDGFKFNDDNR